MDARKVIPAVTAGVLGAAWVVMTARGQTPPPALNQAIVAAVGSIFAGAALPGKATTKELPNEKA
jgi:hypothetical protein